MADTKIEAVSTIITQHTKAISKVAASVRGQITSTCASRVENRFELRALSALGPCGRVALAHFARPLHRTRRDGEMVHPAIRASSRRARAGTAMRPFPPAAPFRGTDRIDDLRCDEFSSLFVNWLCRRRKSCRDLAPGDLLQCLSGGLPLTRPLTTQKGFEQRHRVPRDWSHFSKNFSGHPPRSYAIGGLVLQCGQQD